MQLSTKRSESFGRRPKRWIVMFFVALLLVVAGYVAMVLPAEGCIGDPDGVFALRRIAVAPLMCLAGYVMVGISILNYRS